RKKRSRTGMVVTRIAREFPGFEYTTRRGPAQQLNFIVAVESPQAPSKDGLPSPKLSPEEHQAYAWVGPADSLDDFPMSESMKEVVLKGLEILRTKNN
ncbi:hypothetical protein B0H19DRAFT_956552, partial [Mycena capillaripes]